MVVCRKKKLEKQSVKEVSRRRKLAKKVTFYSRLNLSIGLHDFEFYVK